jgi:hypothetical protein
VKYWQVRSNICLWKPQMTGIFGYVVVACWELDYAVELAAD